MKVRKNTPLICTAELAGQKQFYETHLGFKTVFDAPNYLAMQSQNGTCEVSFMPAECQGNNYEGGSLTLCLQVDDVDKEHARLVERGVPAVQAPKDNPWGDRSAMMLDPIGVCLYLYNKIPMQDEFKQYLKE